MDSLTDGTASLLRYDDRRRQLDLLCVIGAHNILVPDHSDSAPPTTTPYLTMASSTAADWEDHLLGLMILRTC